MRAFIQQFDATVISFIQSWPQWLHGIMYAFSFIGQPIFTIAILVCIGIYGVMEQHTRLLLASLVAGATFGTNSILKLLFQRARPDGYEGSTLIETFSFPSGHAASAVVIFGLVAYLAWHILPHPWSYVVVVLLTVLIIGIGVSRVYLGAHFPSDVLAGWLVGAIGLAIIVWIIKPLS